jgi:nicotinate-nucleotide pyrophosphorylase (carboxylating)
MIPEEYLSKIINSALHEDLGDGDHSSLSCIPQNSQSKAILIAKEDGVIAGIPVAEKVFQIVSDKIKTKCFVDDGQEVNNGDLIMEICGPGIEILGAERTVLNFMQRLSGIATQTRQYVNKLEGLKTKLLDTRKTTPGLRLLEKYAVKMGGGENHRIGLYDMIMLKDNHIDFAGGVKNAILKANEYIIKKQLNIKIEIEVRNFMELQEVMETGMIHRIMLDNFNIEDTAEAVKIIDKKIEIESSGNITLETIREYALCGVDYISCGAITHQIKSLDLSMKAV